MDTIAERRVEMPRNAWGIPQNVGPVDKVVRSAIGGGLVGFVIGRWRRLPIALRLILCFTGCTLIVEAALGF